MNGHYIALDLETTGLSPELDQILEIGAVRVENETITGCYETFVDTGTAIPRKIQDLTGITPEMAAEGLPLREAMEGLIAFCGDWDILGHNLSFDYAFLKYGASRLKLEFERKGIDTLKLARQFLPELPGRSLEELCRYYSIPQEKKHRASWDAIAASRVYQELYARWGEAEPEAFQAKPMYIRIKKESPITNSQKLYLLDLIKYHRIELDVPVDSLTKSQASRQIDRIILEYGRIKR